MIFDLKLDPREISHLIGQLDKLTISDPVELVSILCQDGAEVANLAYGRMAKAEGHIESNEDGIVEGKIVATSSNEDVLLIAEFGAGDATLYPGQFFETHELDADVFPGAYSLFKGTRDYYNFGHWKFGGKWFTEVAPRHGMFNAKLFIKDSYADVARKVMQID